MPDDNRVIQRTASVEDRVDAIQAVLDERWLYRWRLPEDTSGLEHLVASIIGGEIDALAITCQIQFRDSWPMAARPWPSSGCRCPSIIGISWCWKTRRPYKT